MKRILTILTLTALLALPAEAVKPLPAHIASVKLVGTNGALVVVEIPPSDKAVYPLMYRTSRVGSITNWWACVGYVDWKNNSIEIKNIPENWDLKLGERR